MVVLHQRGKVSVKELTRIYSQYSRRTIQRHPKKALEKKKKFQNEKKKTTLGDLGNAQINTKERYCGQ